ncbi:sigma-70 family RNA polymerase sigma factor [Brucella intermedia]|uniref:sigma-70 family RNA polymerase sigma factor n=1 Tax=Brucella intermedia TaxID=94625 RepID=UPI00235F47D7|nr:sigma-70 family RNA polymerase sigma factor [Brucella intermedia]
MSSNSAFEEELLSLLPALRSFSRSLCRQSANAEDLVQETIAKALTHQERFVPFGSLKSWLFTIMKNTFCSTLKKTGRGTVLAELDIPAMPASQNDAMELQDVGRAFEELPNIYRLTLQYVVLEGRPYEVAAKAMNCSVGTVKSRLNRARAQLERCRR